MNRTGLLSALVALAALAAAGCSAALPVPTSRVGAVSVANRSAASAVVQMATPTPAEEPAAPEVSAPEVNAPEVSAPDVSATGGMTVSMSANAELVDTSGRIVARARLSETVEGVTVEVSVQGITVTAAGEHGIHIHQVAACEPDFSAAGGHYNPAAVEHGLENPRGAHAGDFPNINIEADGSATYSTTTTLFTLSPGPTSLFDPDGSALVIHADPDDQMSNPSGKSGDRIACGVIVPGPDPMSMAPQAPTTVSHVVTPKQRPPSQERIDQLQLPAGFEVQLFAEGLDNVRMMAQADDGAIFITRPEQGDVIVLRDADGDGKADGAPETAVSDLPVVHGILIHEGQLYLATDTSLYRAPLTEDSQVGELETLIDDLPAGGQHPKRTLGIGPDGMLYITVGSPCNACAINNPEYATILRANLDGSNRTVFAEGLRNTLGFGWQPETGVMWGMDHGADYRGDNHPPEELNRLEEGSHYGWPYCFGFKEADIYAPYQPMTMTKGVFCETVSAAPVLTTTAHSAPIGMVFYNGDQFPAEYANGAFVAMRGSWNREPASGYKIVHIPFENGEPVGFNDFLGSFLIEDGMAHFGRVAGLLVLQDGSLLISEDTNGVLYRVTYNGESQ